MLASIVPVSLTFSPDSRCVRASLGQPVKLCQPGVADDTLARAPNIKNKKKKKRHHHPGGTVCCYDVLNSSFLSDVPIRKRYLSDLVNATHISNVALRRLCDFIFYSLLWPFIYFIP